MSLYGHTAQHLCICCYNCCIGVFADACVIAAAYIITAACMITAACVIAAAACVITAACVIVYLPHACIWWPVLSSVAILQMTWYHLSANT